MNIILLSGGSGKRLWPLSNDVRSKQFIKLFKNGNDCESMIQRMVRQIKRIDEKANIVVATSKSQLSSIFNQIGDDAVVSVEPNRRDTFPAIILAIEYLVHVLKIDVDEPVIICPVDPFVEDDYFECFKELEKHTSDANLVLMGIEPTYPSEKYGYIIPKNKDKFSEVSSFKEKPNKELASVYIENGALWNGGVFASKISYLDKVGHSLISFSDYEDLYHKYDSLEKISFDYAVVEKEKDARVLRFYGQWKDIGTWNTLCESIDETIIGKGIIDSSKNVHIINELDLPIIACGLKDVVIAASPEGILVSDKMQSSFIKPLVDSFEQQLMFADKSWGFYKVINVEKNSLTIKISLNSGHQMNYHSHKNRDEFWTFVSGEGIVVVDGKSKKVGAGDVVIIRSNCKHTVKAITDLTIIEVQVGEDINVHDKQKYELNKDILD